MPAVSCSPLCKPCGSGRSNQLPHGGAPVEVFKPGPARAKRPPSHWVEDPSSSSCSSRPSLASGTQQPLASPLSRGPQEDQPALRGVTPVSVSQSFQLSNSYLVSPITALSGPDLLHYCLSFFSWWWATVKSTLFSTWAHGSSQQERLSQHPLDTIFWEVPTPWQVEPRRGDHSFIHPDVQNLLYFCKGEELSTLSPSSPGLT